MGGPTGYIYPSKIKIRKRRRKYSPYKWGQCQLCGSEHAQMFDAKVEDSELATVIEKDLNEIKTKFTHDGEGNFSIELCRNCRFETRFIEGQINLNMSTLRLAIRSHVLRG